MDVRSLIFADDAEKQPKLFACGKCGNVVSPKHVGSPEEAARRAEACCQPVPPVPENKCRCGEEIARWSTRCWKCAEAAIIANATVVEQVPDYINPVGSEQFFTSIQDAQESFAGAWAYPCDPEPLAVDPKREAIRAVENIIENMCEEAFEDAADCVNDATELTAAIEAALVVFNEAQTASTWHPITDKIFRIPGAQKDESAA